MNSIRPTLKTAIAVAVAAFISMGPAMAEKPAHAGGGNGNGKSQQQERGPSKSDRRDNDRNAQRDDRGRKDDAGARTERREYERNDRDRRSDPDDRNERRDGPRVGSYFSNDHRDVVRRYYSDRYRANDCPPGLAKKQNGCRPPGIAKKWRIGQPLPRDLVYYDAPADIVIRLGTPPEMHRYVRVGADILLIAVGTGMVIDALEDLNSF